MMDGFPHKSNLRQHVHIVDRPCGTGKTTDILKSFRQGRKYLMVVPLLTEVDRVLQNASVNFRQPTIDKNSTTKSDNLEVLLSEGVNIVTTHSLYTVIASAAGRGMLDDYHIIIDEVLDVVRSVEGKHPKSFKEFYLDRGYAVESPDGLITATTKWDDNFTLVSDTLAPRLYHLAKARTLYRVDGSFFLWALPAALLKAGQSITVYTYMAEGSMMLAYLRKIGIKFSHERDKQESSFRLKARGLIDVRTIPALDKPTIKLSYTGQSAAGGKEDRDKSVSNALKNLKQRNLDDVDMADVLITCSKANWFKDAKSEKPAFTGFARGSRMSGATWLANTTRGTNEHSHSSVCIYLYDQYINPIVKRWLGLGSDRDADDRYALAELIQWVYRSRVRQGKPITLYIPSKRMRMLFEDWLTGTSNCEESLSMVA